MMPDGSDRFDITRPLVGLVRAGRESHRVQVTEAAAFGGQPEPPRPRRPAGRRGQGAPERSSDRTPQRLGHCAVTLRPGLQRHPPVPGTREARPVPHSCGRYPEAIWYHRNLARSVPDVPPGPCGKRATKPVRPHRRTRPGLLHIPVDPVCRSPRACPDRATPNLVHRPHHKPSINFARNRHEISKTLRSG